MITTDAMDDEEAMSNVFIASVIKSIHAIHLQLSLLAVSYCLLITVVGLHKKRMKLCSLDLRDCGSRFTDALKLAKSLGHKHSQESRTRSFGNGCTLGHQSAVYAVQWHIKHSTKCA